MKVQLVAKLILFYEAFSWRPYTKAHTTQRKTSNSSLMCIFHICMTDTQGLKPLKELPADSERALSVGKGDCHKT